MVNGLKKLDDGLLFSFDSSLEAVRCSIQIQETLKDIDDLNIRIGIHQGDIFIKDGDVFGDDVNIASRVEGFSPIGGISISDKVHKDISGVSDIKTSFLGHRKLKGVEQETKLRCIVSNELPNSTSAFNSFIYSISGFLIFWGIAEILNSIYDLFQLKSNNLCGELTGIITYLLIGVLCILAGYNNYSYIKGVSNRAQMNFIIFSIAIILLAVFNVIMGYNCCNDCP